MDSLKQDLKEKIIRQLNLESVSAGDILDEAPLFGDGLGLDSIDALELIVMLDKFYGVKIESPEMAKDLFFSVNTLALFLKGKGIQGPIAGS